MILAWLSVIAPVLVLALLFAGPPALWLVTDRATRSPVEALAALLRPIWRALRVLYWELPLRLATGRYRPKPPPKPVEHYWDPVPGSQRAWCSCGSDARVYGDAHKAHPQVICLDCGADVSRCGCDDLTPLATRPPKNYAEHNLPDNLVQQALEALDACSASEDYGANMNRVRGVVRAMTEEGHDRSDADEVLFDRLIDRFHLDEDMYRQQQREEEIKRKRAEALERVRQRVAVLYDQVTSRPARAASPLVVRTVPLPHTSGEALIIEVPDLAKREPTRILVSPLPAVTAKLSVPPMVAQVLVLSYLRWQHGGRTAEARDALARALEAFAQFQFGPGEAQLWDHIWCQFTE